MSSFVEDSDLRVRMLAFVLLLPLTAAVSVVGRTDLIDGHFKYKVGFKSGQVSNNEVDCRLRLGTG